jgi:putative endonuclease
VHQHREELASGFTAKYHVKRLVWFETYDDISDAIVRERRIKSGNAPGKSRLLRRRTHCGTTWR